MKKKTLTKLALHTEIVRGLATDGLALVHGAARNPTVSLCADPYCVPSLNCPPTRSC
jgi:hypothetical protein